MTDLFADQQPSVQALVEDTYLLKGFALQHDAAILAGLAQVVELAPLRNSVTPGGFKMSVAMSNCGDLGWVTDTKGYRYTIQDPLSGKPWPAMPAAFKLLAQQAAKTVGYEHFEPDACLINQYKVGASMGLHQDKNETDFNQPIVSISLGLPAVFLFGGSLRSDKPLKVPLAHGDVVVWGGKARLNFHGISPVKAHPHSMMDARLDGHLNKHRFNLTLRKAG
ncbi:MAG: DNA oxidative demethylase AlkB [Pseudomonadota bacterium]